MALATKPALDDSAASLVRELPGMTASHTNQPDLSVASGPLVSDPSASLVEPTLTTDSAFDLDRMDVAAMN